MESSRNQPEKKLAGSVTMAGGEAGVVIEPSPLGSSAERFFRDVVDDLSPGKSTLVVATMSTSWDLMDDDEAAPGAEEPPETTTARRRPGRAAPALVLVLLALGGALALALSSPPARPAAPDRRPPPPRRDAADAYAVAVQAPREELALRPPPHELLTTYSLQVERKTEARVAAAVGLGGLAFLVGIPYVPGLFDNALLGVLATLAPVLSLAPAPDA